MSIVLLFFAWFAQAQDKPVYDVWRERPLNQNDLAFWYQGSALGRADISDITQDSTGYIWMATSEGLLRFDGNDVKTYDLSNVDAFERDAFVQIAAGPKSELWMASAEDLFYFKDDEFRLWADSLGQLKAGISQLEFDSDGQLWAVVNNLLYRVDGNHAVKDPLGIGEIKSLIKCQENLLWVVDTAGEVFTIHGDTLSPMPQLKPLFKEDILHVIGNIERAIYVALENGEVYRVDESGSHIIKLNEKPKAGITGEIIHSLFADSQGFVWVLSHDNLYRIQGTKVEEVNWSFSLNDYHVNDVFEDRDGDFWIGTYSGLSFLYQSAVGFMEYYEGDEAALTTSVVEDSKGNIWVGSDNMGLLMIKDHRLIKAPNSTSLPKSIKTVIALKNGNLLIGGDEGLIEVKFDGSKFITIDKLSSQPTRAVYEDNFEQLWINQSGENNEQITKIVGSTTRQLQELNGKRVYFWYETKDQGVLLGTNEGLFLCAKDSIKLLGQELGLQTETFVTYEQHKGKVWLSSKSRGLVEWDGDSLRVINSKNNFRIKSSSSMTMDDQGGAWFGVNFGVFYTPIKEFENLISENDSLHNVEFYAISSSDNSEGYPLKWKVSNGEIFLTTDRGLVEIHPEFKPKRKPILDIESYSTATEVIPVRNNEIRLSKDESNVLINYSAIDYLNYDNLEFEFTLEGFDDQWNRAAQRTAAVYTNLPGGTYTFKLRLSHHDDVSVKSITIIKEPLWVETAWFKMLLGLVIVFFVFAFIRWRNYRVREKNRSLKIEVDQRTAELQQVLSSLEDTVEERTEALTKTIEQLNMAMDVGKLASFIEDYDDQGNLINGIYVDQFYDLIGYTEEEVPRSREGWNSIVHPDDLVYITREFKRITESYKPENESVADFWTEYRIKHKSGHYIWMESMSKIVERHPNGAIKKFVGIIADIDERKKIELERLETEERFRHVFEAGPNGLLLVNESGGFEIFNERALAMFGYGKEELRDLLIENLIPKCSERQGKFSLSCVEDCATDGQNGGYYGLRSNGEEFPIKIELSPIRIREEELILAVITDMTHEAEMEDALEQSRKQLRLDRDKYQSVFENINDALFIIEVEGDKFKFIEFNTVEEQITGLTNDQISGKYTHELFPKFSEYLDWRYASCRDTGEIITYQEKLKFRGEDQDFQTSLVPLKEDGKVVRIIGIAHEITELLKSQQVIKDREEKLRFALEATQDAVIDWDLKTGMVEVSPVLYRMLGYKLNSVNEHILGIIKLFNKSDLDVSTQEEFKEQIEYVGDRQFARELRMKMFDSSWLWVLLRGKLVRSDAGEAIRFIGTISDISKEKRKTKDKLEAILATEDNERRRISREIHDGLQQTLTISALNMEFIKRELSKLSEMGQKKYTQGWDYLQKSIAESRSVAHTLMPKAIVDFGLVSACKSLIMEFNNSVETVFFRFEHNLKSDQSFDQNIEVTLYRILQEGLNNIIKYAEATEVNVQLRDYNDILMLTIEDDGKGFNLEDVKMRDKGLGLKSMQNRIDAISGVLEIDSAPGRGTVILVQIPKDVLTEV